jgi:WD40 repeat protein
VLSAGEDNTVRVWNVTSGAEQRCFERRTNRVAALASDGRLVLSGSLYDGMLRLWDVTTGEELRRFQGHTDFVHGIAYAPDDRRALSVSQDQTVRLWDVAGGRQLRVFNVKRTMGGPSPASPGRHPEVHYVPGRFVAISPDGLRALFVGPTASLSLWNLGAGKESLWFSHHGLVVSDAKFSPDGRCVVSAGTDGVVRLWHGENGRELTRFPGHQGEATSVAVSPDGRQAVSGGVDQTVRVWEMQE